VVLTDTSGTRYELERDPEDLGEPVGRVDRVDDEKDVCGLMKKIVNSVYVGLLDCPESAV